MTLTIVVGDRQRACALQPVLTAKLPEWFGQPAANRHYAEQAAVLPSWIALVDGRECGLLLLKRHGPASAEIYWMAVDPGFHGRGVGTALLDAVCAAMRAEERRTLFALTLGPQSPNAAYRRSRQFYQKHGFFLGVAEHGETVGTHPMAYYVKLLEP
jgi:GNAT superfamily N-acetyltransferase